MIQFVSTCVRNIESQQEGYSIVRRPEDESEQDRLWSSLSQAGFLEIAPDEVAERIKEAKLVVIGRLSELLQVTTDLRERESAACSLATLKKLETTVGRHARERSSE